MNEFRIDWTNLTAFVAGLRNAPAILGEELLAAARTISSRGADLSRVYAPVASGQAKGSVYSRATQSGAGASAIWGASSEHAFWADHGRPPGKMPPAGALVGWHGITAAEEFPVRRAIGRRGTKGTPFVSRAFKEIGTGFAQAEFGKAIGRALRRIGGG